MTVREKVILEGEDRASQSFDKAGGAFEKMGSTFKKVAVAGGLAIAVRQLGRLGTELTGMAIDAAEAESAFNTTFGSALPQASAFVEEFANKAGFATGEMQQMLAVTGNVAQGIGATEEESAILAESMARLAGDVASFSNAAGGAPAVLAALQSALNGEREALKTYGLAISEAEVQQRALMETGKESAEELTRLEKAQATMTIAYEKAGKAVGDLDRTQDSAANTLRRLQAKFKEIGTDLGRTVLPALEAVLPLVEDIADGIQEQLEEIDFGQLTQNVRLFFANLERLSELGPISIWNDAESKALRDFFAKVRNGVDDIDALDFVLRRLTSESLSTSEMGEIADKLIDLSDVDPAGLLALGDALVPMGPQLHGIAPEIQVLIDALREAAREELSGGLAMIPPPLDEISRASAGAADAAARVQIPLEDLLENAPDTAKAILEMVPAAQEAAAAFRDDLAGAAEDFIDGFSELPDEIDTTMDDFEKNLTERIAAQETFWAGLTTLAEAGFGNLAEKIREQGPAATGLLEELIGDMERAAELDEMISQAGDQMEDVTDEYATALERNADPTLTALGQFGQEMIDAIAAGIESGDLAGPLLRHIQSEVGRVTGRTSLATPGRPGGATGRTGPFQEGTWSVPGNPSEAVNAVVHGTEIIIPPSGSSGRAEFARQLAAEMGRVLGDNGPAGRGGVNVTIEQIQVLVPAGATMQEAINAATAQAAVEAIMS